MGRAPRSASGVVTAMALVLLALLALAAYAERPSFAGGMSAVGAVQAALWTIEVLLVLFAVMLVLSARATRPDAPPPRLGLPDVDLLVPIRDESPEVLAETLDAVAALQCGPGRLRVVVVDDSTDPELMRAAADAAHARGFTHLTRATRRGYKAGALNHALAHTDAPFVAVLDVDHVPERDFLRVALSGFDDGPDGAKVACVQTRLGWRNADAGIRRLAGILQDQFFGVIQWDRAARGSAVFAGSAAIFRRQALESVGGFPEQTLVEDLDLTVQLQTGGWRIRYDDRLGARGLLPWNGRDVARQLWRWSHGSTRVLRLRAARIVRARLPLAHRLELLVSAGAYVAGGAFVLAGLLLAAQTALGGAPPSRGWAPVPLALLTPAAILGAHVATAALGLSRAGRRDLGLLLPYHLVTLAFTPVLTMSSLLGLVSPRAGGEGRVAKAAGQAAAGGGPALPLFAAATAALGAALLYAAWHMHAAHALGAALWALELGAAFLLPLALWRDGAARARVAARGSVASARPENQ